MLKNKIKNTFVIVLVFILFTFVLTEDKTIDDLILEAETAVTNIHDEMLTRYNSVCEDDCKCSYHMCSNLSIELSCDEDYDNNNCPTTECFGSKINKGKSGVMFGNKYETVSRYDDRVIQATCYSEHLTSIAKDNRKDSDSFHFQYYGSSEGVFRHYPLNETCGPYDPRTRPWYENALSDPKNVLILYDNSSEMDLNNRSDLALSYVTRLLNTVNNVDKIAFISYNDRTIALFDEFTIGSEAAKSRILAHIDGLVGFGNPNLNKGIKDTYEFIRNSNTNGSLLNSSTIIFIVSAGGILSNTNNLADLLTLNSEEKNGFTVDANVYPILIGNNETNIALFRSIACQELGIFSQILDNQDVNVAVADKFTKVLFINKKTSHVIWTEPYPDASGAGMVVTAAQAVIDSTVTPPRLAGVVGIDIKLNDMLSLATTDDLITKLKQRTAQNNLVLSSNNCVLDQLRPTNDKCYTDSTVTDTCVVNSTVISQAEICPNKQQYVICGEDEETTLLIKSEMPIDYSCCVDCLTFNRDAIVSSVVIGVVLLIIAIILLVCCITKQKRLEELEEKGHHRVENTEHKNEESKPQIEEKKPDKQQEEQKPE